MASPVVYAPSSKRAIMAASAKRLGAGIPFAGYNLTRIKELDPDKGT
jgi:hypothetical protein